MLWIRCVCYGQGTLAYNYIIRIELSHNKMSK